jgi:hypothetical protein
MKKLDLIIRHFTRKNTTSSRSVDIHWTNKLYTLIKPECSLPDSQKLTNRTTFQISTYETMYQKYISFEKAYVSIKAEVL